MTILESLSLYPALKEKKNIGKEETDPLPTRINWRGPRSSKSSHSVDDLGGVACRAKGEEGAADRPSKPTGGRGKPTHSPGADGKPRARAAVQGLTALPLFSAEPVSCLAFGIFSYTGRGRPLGLV